MTVSFTQPAAEGLTGKFSSSAWTCCQKNYYCNWKYK